MQFRRATFSANASARLRDERWRLASMRLVLALFAILALSIMPISMSHKMASAHAAPTQSVTMDHCAAPQGTEHGKHPASAKACAMACTMIEPAAPQLAGRSCSARAVLLSPPSPALVGIAPGATSPPPRLFS